MANRKVKVFFIWPFIFSSKKIKKAVQRVWIYNFGRDFFIKNNFMSLFIKLFQWSIHFSDGF